MRRRIIRQIARILKGYGYISDLAGNAVFIIDMEGGIFSANRTAQIMTGYTKKELMNMTVKELHPPEELKRCLRKLSAVIKSKKELNFMCKILKKDGAIINVKIAANKFIFKKEPFIVNVAIPTDADEKTLSGEPAEDIKRNGRKISNLFTRADKKYLDYASILVDLAESREPYTMKHSLKVTNYAVSLAKALKLPKKEIENLRISSMLHDVGKIGVKSSVLAKSSPLNRQEYAEVKKHPLFGVEIIKSIHLMDDLIPIIAHHHENYDGTGYPHGLKGKAIPLGARIVSIVDVYDALISNRVYRKAYTKKEALDIMRNESGKKFDPHILKIFLKQMSNAKK